MLTKKLNWLSRNVTPDYSPLFILKDTQLSRPF